MYKKFSLYFILISLLFFFSACGSLMPKHASGPVFTPVKLSRGQAVIYFYRPERISMSATTNFMSIPLEADNCYAMVNGGYFAYVTKPGRVNVGAVALSSGVKKYSISVKAGDSKYVDVSFGEWGPTPEFKDVAEKDALLAIQKLHLISTCKK